MRVTQTPQSADPRAGVPSEPFVDIAWVNEIVWGRAVETTIGRQAAAPSAATLASFVAVPSAKHPHLLVPYEARAAAWRALENYTDARLSVRAGAALLGIGFRAGIPQLVGRRVRVSLADPGAEDSIRQPLTQYLADVLGRRDLEFAVRMGGRRPNRKPVVQVLTRSGEILAYAKVGWNPLTRSLVRNEADVLAGFAERAKPLNTFSVPRLIATGQCGDLDVLVIAPIPPEPWLAGAPAPAQLCEASQEIASLGKQGREDLARSRWWKRIRARLDALRPSLRESRFETLQDLVALIEEHYADTRLAFGRCHGDWTCWNMSRRDSKLVVFDWERSGDLAPVGLDAAHYDFDLAVKARKTPPLEAVSQLLGGRGALLPLVAPDPSIARLLLSLDLLEMVLRFEEARSAGLDIADTTYFGALRSAVLSRPPERL